MFHIPDNFDRSYNMCIAICFVRVLVHICDPKSQFMLPWLYQTVQFKAPLQHLNSIQNLEQNVVTVGCKAFFLPLFFLSISSFEQADLLNVLCYLICHVGDFFLKFSHLYWLHPSSFFHLSSFTSPLHFLFSFSLNVRYFLHVESQCSLSLSSIVDRTMIWKILKRAWFQCIY